MNKRMALWLLGLFLFMFLPCYSFADLIVLKDGRSIEGFILSQDELNVQVDIGQGIVNFERKDIQSVQKNEPQGVSLIQKKISGSELVKQAIKESKANQVRAKENQDENKKHGN